MTGFRIGYAAGPAHIIGNITKLQENISACVAMPSQYAALEALRGERDHLDFMVESYRKRRDYLADRLRSMPLVRYTPVSYTHLVPLLLGFAVTIAVTARIMNMLIERYYGIVSKIILGFVISSVLMIAPTMFEGLSQVLTGLVCFAAGFVLAMWMDGRSRAIQ